jgi:hypothetical protein
VPIVRAAGRVFRRASLSGTVDLVASPQFDPENDVVLRGPDQDAAEGAAPSRADGITRQGNGLSARIASPNGAVTVFAATYFRYWRAAVDGAPASVEIANGTFCGVRVPPGAHRVELFYDERPFRTGAALSLGAAAAGILFIAAGRRRSRLSPGA